MKITPKTFHELYNAYFESLCGFLCYYTRDSETIQEVVQDVFVSLWENRESVEIEYIRTYLFKSARNRMLNYIRDEKNHKERLMKYYEKETENKKGREIVNIDELFYYIQLIVDQLPSRCKEIYRMCREENLSYKEIARKLKISEKTVENHMGLALKRIKLNLRKYYNIQ